MAPLRGCSSQKVLWPGNRARYDKAVAKLETLMAKREEIRTKELMIAIASSDRSYEEGLRFIKG